jgi:hypothetical protein
VYREATSRSSAIVQISLIDRQSIDDMFGVTEPGVAPESQPCLEPERIAEPERISAFERGLETILVEQQEFEGGAKSR